VGSRYATLHGQRWIVEWVITVQDEPPPNTKCVAVTCVRLLSYTPSMLTQPNICKLAN
jgi:hypothetical protein